MLMGGISSIHAEGASDQTETRDVRDFDRVVLETGGNLTVQYGKQESLTINAPNNILQNIITEVRERTLMIGFKDRTSGYIGSITYNLTMIEINGLATVSSGNIQAAEVITKKLKIRSSSSGSITVDSLHTDYVGVLLNSGGNCTIHGGEIDELNATLSSSGDLIAGTLKSRTASLKLNSSGNATVWVTAEMNVSMVSSGNLMFYGNPQVNSKIVGTGHLRALGKK